MKREQLFGQHEQLVTHANYRVQEFEIFGRNLIDNERNLPRRLGAEQTGTFLDRRIQAAHFGQHVMQLDDRRLSESLREDKCPPVLHRHDRVKHGYTVVRKGVIEDDNRVFQSPDAAEETLRRHQLCKGALA